MEYKLEVQRREKYSDRRRGKGEQRGFIVSIVKS